MDAQTPQRLIENWLNGISYKPDTILSFLSILSVALYTSLRKEGKDIYLQRRKNSWNIFSFSLSNAAAMEEQRAAVYFSLDIHGSSKAKSS